MCSCIFIRGAKELSSEFASSIASTFVPALIVALGDELSQTKQAASAALCCVCRLTVVLVFGVFCLVGAGCFAGVLFGRFGLVVSLLLGGFLRRAAGMSSAPGPGRPRSIHRRRWRTAILR